MKNKNDMFVDIKVAHSEVTGSLIKCCVRFPNGEKTRFIIDCGLFQEEKYDNLNYILDFDPSQYEFAICTHTHIDHCGRFPMLVKKGFNGPIYISDIGAELIKPALENTLKILETNATNSKSGKKEPIFDALDLENTFQLIRPKEFFKSFNPAKHIKVLFYKNDHILGAAMVEICITYKGKDPIFLKFTGDYNVKNYFFNTRKLPKSLTSAPVTIIQEATYGSTETVSVEKTFEGNICRAISKGYTVVIPVFAFERAQLIMLMLKRLQNSGAINTSVPIYLDGELAIKYTDIYKRYSYSFLKDSRDFIPSNFSFVTDQEKRLSLMNTKVQKILLTTSGMGGWGPSKLYLPYFAEQKKCLIQFSGYTSKCSLGRKLLEAKPNEEIVLCDGTKFTKKAIVKTTSEFSSHAKADQNIDFINQFERPQTVLINHGETAVKELYKEKVLEETKAKIVSVLQRNEVHRIGPYGLIKKFMDNN